VQQRVRGWVPYEPIASMFGPVSDHAIAKRLGVNRTTVGHWRRSGQVPLGTADRVACELGLHPLNLWPDYNERYSR
jgi:hypothetical protein